MAMNQQDFDRQIRELIRQAVAVDKAAVQAALRALDGAHKEIIRDIAGLPPDASSYTKFQLDGLKRAVERAMEDFQRILTSEMKQAQAHAYDQGKENVDRVLLDSIGTPATLADLSRTQLLIAQGYSADLVTNLSAVARARLNATLSRSFLGGQSALDIIKQIGRAVGQGELGIFSRRAQTIYRTEVLRMMGAATQARMEQAAARGIALKKMWVHAGLPAHPRVWHVQIDRQVQPVDKPFELPAGGPGGGPEELMYPRDPAASAENTINCGCQSFPWMDSFAGFGGLTAAA